MYSRSLTLAALMVSGLPAATLLRVACGGPADAYFTGGYSWTAANQPALAALAAPYNALRASSGGPVTYTIPALPGQTSVTLRFLEPNKTGAGQRVFAVAVNGVTVRPALDLAAAAGLLHPVDYTFGVRPNVPTVIRLTPVVGNAVISGIDLDGGAPAEWGGLSVGCKSGTVSYAALTASATVQDVVIVPAVTDTFRILHVAVRELEQFAGPVGDLTVLMAPNLTPPLRLKANPAPMNVWTDRPTWPLSGWPYDIALRFTGTPALGGGNLIGGAVWWEVCGFESQQPTAAAREACACPSGTPCGWFRCSPPGSADCEAAARQNWVTPRGNWVSGPKEECAIALSPVPRLCPNGLIDERRGGCANL